jgi:hypothetical protein
MSEPNGLLTKDRFRVSALLGILFLIIGVSLLGYSITIKDYEQSPNSTDTTLKQIWYYNGSLTWWTKAFFTLFLPFTSVFIILSGVILVIQPILAKLRHKNIQ